MTEKNLGIGLDYEVDEDGYIVAPEGKDFGLSVDDNTHPVVPVELPSGNLTYLEVPGLACLLWAGASEQRMVDSIWRHPQGSPALFDLDEQDVLYIYEWGLTEFAKRKESLGISSVCKTFGKVPSDYVGILDKTTGFLFDIAMAGTLADEEERAMKDIEKGNKGGRSKNLGPDPQEEFK